MILIKTIDNPGWSITIDLQNLVSIHKQVLSDINIDENNWYYCVIKNCVFEGDGGPLNLIDILEVAQLFFQNISCDFLVPLIAKKTLEEFAYLQEWYCSQCDGDWEHEHGIKIKKVDHLNWSITISLCETELQKRTFQNVGFERSETDRLSCEVFGGFFKGKCSTNNLVEVLKLFHYWTSLSAF